MFEPVQVLGQRQSDDIGHGYTPFYGIEARSGHQFFRQMYVSSLHSTMLAGVYVHFNA